MITREAISHRWLEEKVAAKIETLQCGLAKVDRDSADAWVCEVYEKLIARQERVLKSLRR